MKKIFTYALALSISLPLTAQTVGERVNIKATDGKTYKGTIKEVVTGYIIKYDDFDQPVVVTKDQFTLEQPQLPVQKKSGPVNTIATKPTVAENSTKSLETPNARWDKFGRFKIGDEVLFSPDRGGRWERGKVEDIKPIEDVPSVAGVLFYVVYNEARSNSRSYFDHVYVTTLERQPYWTNFFMGDWDLQLPMAITIEKKGNDVYRVYSGGDKLPPLRVSADRTYSWAIDDKKVIRGSWKPNENAPGIVLINGDRGVDWILSNTSEANSLKTFGTETIKIGTPSGSYIQKIGYRIKKK